MDDDLRTMNCGNCLHWRDGGFGNGNCQRFPPTVVRVDGKNETAWPETERGWQCGEWVHADPALRTEAINSAIDA